MMKSLLPLLLLLSLSFLPSALAAPLIQVDAARVTGSVNELGFGHNMEAADGRGLFDEAHDAPTFRLDGVKYGQGLWDPALPGPNRLVADLLEPYRIGMMRYPGGCLAHTFDWRRAVGPLTERPEWKFGIDEYIALCHEMNWEPVFTLTDYALPAAELPQHLADLVEYLNAPARPEFPWAMKRAEWGNPEPYGVRYFELGNESRHGSHKTVPLRTFTAEEYVTYAVDSIAAIRRIDPGVKLGIVTIPGTAVDWNCEWNRQVIAGAGPHADFLVIHIYGPTLDGQDAATATWRALAYPDQLRKRLSQYRGLTRELAGRELPLAVTEYNVGAFGDDPTPLRFSYLSGLMNAELLRLWQEPENRVEFANYWHLLNGYWGGLRTDANGSEIKRRLATLPFFEAWGVYRGDQIVAAAIHDNPRVTAGSGPGLMPSMGDRYSAGGRIGSQNSFDFHFGAFKDDTATGSAVGTAGARFVFNQAHKDFFPVFGKVHRPRNLAAGEALEIQLTFEMRFLPETRGEIPAVKMGLGLSDPRGWARTRSAAAFTVTGPKAEWTKVTNSFTTLSDADGANLVLRFEEAAAPVSGTLEFRNIRAELKSGEKFSAYPALTAFATRSTDDQSLYLIVINKDPVNLIEAEVRLDNFPAATGQSLLLFQEDTASTEYFEGETGSVALTDGSFRNRFPQHSMTAFKFQLPEEP